MPPIGICPFQVAYLLVQLLGISCLIAIRMTEQRQRCRLCQGLFLGMLSLVFSATLAAQMAGIEAWTLGYLTLGTMVLGATLDCRRQVRPSY